MRWLAMALVVACSGGDEDVTTDTPEKSPVWYGEVDALVRDNCLSCHQTGGIGIMPLAEYADAKTWAPAMKAAVQSRTMPPFLATDDGTCQDFRDSLWMADEDIATLAAWADAGAPAGDEADASDVTVPPLPALDRVDLAVQTPEFAPVAVGSAYAMNDEYRCFLVEDPTDTDTFLTGFEVFPGNEAIVHHLLLMPIDPAAEGYDGRTNLENIQEMDGADGRLGWPCFGTAGGNVSIRSIPVTWAPGMGAVEFPEGFGLYVASTDMMVVQLHYNMIDPATHGQTDSTRVDLRTEPVVERPAYYALPDAFLESAFYGDPEIIPPGEEAHTFSFSGAGWELAAAAGVPYEDWFDGYELVGAMPHMHQLGVKQSMTVNKAASGEDECLMDVQRWDYAWQLQYFYEEPVRIEADDVVTITCTWDSTGQEAPTFPGWGTSDEMCLMTMMLAP